MVMSEAKQMIKTELYLGRGRPPRPGMISEVTDNEFEWFIRDHVAPRVPGFTLLEGEGYWKGTPERATVLVIVHLDTGLDYDTITGIAESYKRAFSQESVLRVDALVRMTVL